MKNLDASPSAQDAEVLADQVRTLQSTLVSTVLGNLVLGVVVLVALRNSVTLWVGVAWAGALASHCALNLHVARTLRARPVSARNAARRAHAAVTSAAALGVIWASGLLLLWPKASTQLQFLLVFLVAGVSSGALHSLAAHLPTFQAFFWPCMVAVVLACLREGTEVFLWMAAIAAVYATVTARYAESLNRALVESFRRRHEVTALATSLRTQIKRTEAAQQSRSRFLAAASHDLRQPAHALRLLLGPLHAAALPAPHGDRVRQALAAADSLSALFESLLDLSRIEAGAVAPVLRAVELRQLVEHLADEFAPLAAERGLALRWRCRVGEVAVACSDVLLLERILRNLLSNALRYTTRGGVVVAVRPGAAQGWRLSVADTGPGMSAEDQERIFDEFVQLGEPAQRRGGFGLGLAIVRGLATVLQHPLTLRSRPGRGTRVDIAVPAAIAPVGGVADRSASSPMVPSEFAPAFLAGACVALIDDDASVRSATADLLGGWGAQVVTSASADEALSAWRERPAAPDCVVTDLNLGGSIDGVTLVGALREEFNAGIAAVLVCASPSAEQRDAARRAGLAIVLKPCAPQALGIALAQAWPAAKG